MSRGLHGICNKLIKLGLNHVNYRDICHGDIDHGQPIDKYVSFHTIRKDYERITKFDDSFYKEDFIDWLLDLEDFLFLFLNMDISEEKKVEIVFVQA